MYYVEYTLYLMRVCLILIYQHLLHICSDDTQIVALLHRTLISFIYTTSTETMHQK